MHCYVLCSKVHEKERYEALLKTLHLIGLPYTIVEPIWYTDDLFDRTRYNDAFTTEPCTDGAIALFLSYEKLFDLIVTKDDKHVLILESDVLFQMRNSQWNYFLERIATNVDGPIFLGGGPPTFPRNDTTLYDTEQVQKILSLIKRPQNGALRKTNISRCTDSMIWSKSDIQMILPYLKDQFHMPIDHYLSYLFFKLKMNAYWTTTPVFIQGSQNGTWTSNISIKK